MPPPEVEDKYIVYPFLKPYEESNNHVDLRFIHKTYENPPLIQAFSCFAETRKVDFSKSQTRDEVSFYKKLARMRQAEKLNMNEDDYDKLLKMTKTGKFELKMIKETAVRESSKGIVNSSGSIKRCH